MEHRHAICGSDHFRTPFRANCLDTNDMRAPQSRVICASLLLLASGGCYILGLGSGLTAKEIADRLEQYPIGTSYQDIIQSFPGITKRAAELTNVGIHVHRWLLANPYDDGWRDLTIYRQYPSGILLDLKETDIWFAPRIRDEFNSSAVLAVFFDSKMRYKGYFTDSSSWRSKDSKERFEAEKKRYRILGFIAESARAYESVKTIGGEPEASKNLPKLPLSSNRATNSVPKS